MINVQLKQGPFLVIKMPHSVYTGIITYGQLAMWLISFLFISATSGLIKAQWSLKQPAMQCLPGGLGAQGIEGGNVALVATEEFVI